MRRRFPRKTHASSASPYFLEHGLFLRLRSVFTYGLHSLALTKGIANGTSEGSARSGTLHPIRDSEEFGVTKFGVTKVSDWMFMRNS